MSRETDRRSPSPAGTTPRLGYFHGAASRGTRLASHRVWIALSIFLVAAGAIGSTLEAETIARSDGSISRQAFVASAAQVASTLQLAIEREQDLTVSANAFFVANPDATQAQFLQWIRSVRAFARYPELQGISEVQIVPASQLGAFAARQDENPTGSVARNGTFQITPAGDRPYYCLAAVAASRTSALQLPVGLDYCKTVLGADLLAARDSGRDEYLPYKLSTTEELAVGSAIYRDGVVPGTVAGRRAALIGWTGTAVLPAVVLDTSLDNHRSAAVELRYQSDTAMVNLRAGRAPPGAQSTSINLASGWRVQVFGPVSGSGILANRNSLYLLMGGLAVCTLGGLLIYVLGTGRSRALKLVGDQTDELRHQAFHDSLTGLPNRALILDRIGQMMARARREDVTVSALFLDLDNFKDINDSLGHKSGDELLAQVGIRLAGIVRAGDTVGRLGGDEFVMLVMGTHPDIAELVAQRIFAALEPPFEISGSDVPLTVTASIGIASGNQGTPEELLRNADIALYRAKAAGKQRAAVFTHSMLESVDDNRSLDIDLHAALPAGQFFVLYQPTIDLRSGAFTGVEALLRWRHPTRGVVQPADFVPSLDSSGLIIPVGRWVLETACRQGARWQREGHPLKVSVNVAAKQLQRDRIVDDVRSALRATGFDPTMLVLEVTESTLMKDVELTATRLGQLKALGVRVAIDDFGTGFSSLAYLQQFPVDVLKIDRSFVADITETAKSAAIIRAFVQLGRALSLEVVAEGIERQDQQARLCAEGVDTGQGYLFARPLDVEAVDGLLLEYTANAVVGSRCALAELCRAVDPRVCCSRTTQAPAVPDLQAISG